MVTIATVPVIKLRNVVGATVAADAIVAGLELLSLPTVDKS